MALPSIIGPSNSDQSCNQKCQKLNAYFGDEPNTYRMYRNLLELYFGQHDNRQIVYHQISSFNHFMEAEVPQTILRSCPIRVTGSPDLNLTGTTRAAAGTAGTAIRVSIEPAVEEALLKKQAETTHPREVEVCVEFANVQLRKPTIFENNEIGRAHV